jgi:RNA polymerase sigma-70 factor, ECF subfamily
VDPIRLTSDNELTELVNRILAGDMAAEDELVRRYQHGVAVIIEQIVRNRSITEDISQDTFRIVIAKVRRGDLRDAERLSGFVCGVARNTAVAHIRKLRHSQNHHTIADAEHIADSTPNQLDKVLRDEQSKAVRQLINELKQKRDRDLLFRYYIGEEDKDKICQDLSLTRAQFHNVIFRATRRFKELYLQKKAQLEESGDRSSPKRTLQ